MARTNRAGGRSSPKPCKTCGHSKKDHVKRKLRCKVCNCKIYIRNYKDWE